MLAVLLTLVPPGVARHPCRFGRRAPWPSAVSVGRCRAAERDATYRPGPAAEIDPVTAASELLEVRASCLASRDLDCLAAVAQPGSPIAASDRALMLADGSEGGAAPEPFDLGAIALVADMGSAVLLEVPYADAEREPASLLMMRSEAGWRLRELFD